MKQYIDKNKIMANGDGLVQTIPIGCQFQNYQKNRRLNYDKRRRKTATIYKENISLLL